MFHTSVRSGFPNVLVLPSVEWHTSQIKFTHQTASLITPHFSSYIKLGPQREGSSGCKNSVLRATACVSTEAEDTEHLTCKHAETHQEGAGPDTDECLYS